MVFLLQVTRTIKKGCVRISATQPQNVELAALARLENPIDLLWKKCCNQSGAFILDLIFFILVGNKDIHERLDEFEFRSSPLLAMELAALVRLKNIDTQVFSSIFLYPFKTCR